MDDKQQKIIEQLQRIAELLQRRSITKREFNQYGEISIKTVERAFGSWNRAIEAAGLTANPATFAPGGIPLISDEELLTEIRRLASELGKTPSITELEAFGKYSVKPYKDRWGRYSEAVRIALATDQDSFSTSPTSTSNLSPQVPPLRDTKPVLSPSTKTAISGSARKKIQYGEPIDFRGLRHAPVNEQGVVYMFGMVSRELGFLIESIRTAYPDCEGKWLVDEKRQLWEHVLIEFEFRSSNFLEHGHNPNECDVIVCWTHDWANCPSNLTVIELKSAIANLPNK